MERAPRSEHKVWELWGLIALAITYEIFLQYHRMLVDNHIVVGSIGVILGLYICSHPAARFVDLIFFGRFLSLRSEGWQKHLPGLVLNILVFIVGWLVIVSGTTKFMQK